MTEIIVRLKINNKKTAEQEEEIEKIRREHCFDVRMENPSSRIYMEKCNAHRKRGLDRLVIIC